MDNRRDEFELFRRSSDDRSIHDEPKESPLDSAEEPKSAASADDNERLNYYAYGPYQSHSERTPEPKREETKHTTYQDGIHSEPVEVTPPKLLRPFSIGGGGDSSPPGPVGPANGGWQFEQPKKKSRVRSNFAAFLAGALVVSTLMFAADKYNLFTGSAGVMAGAEAGQTQSSNNSGSGNSGVVSSSFDLGRPDSIAQIVEQASPAVVKIETLVKTRSSSRGNSIYNDPFFRYFFGDSYGGQSQQQQEEQLQPGGMGSGFIFEKSGYILTNEHVIEGADQINVYVQGYDEPFKAELLGNSYDLDLAALKITGDKDFPTIPIGNPDEMNVGDWVVAIGNPLGFDHTVTVGVLSAKERPITIPDSNGTRQYQHLLQTDASINQGNSGGPLLNLKGEVIGINTAVSAQAQGIGFAIPTSTVQSVLHNLKNNITIPKEPAPYIGVGLENIDKDWVSDLKLDNTDGAIISEVVRRSPAFEAGLRPYDVITEINGKKIKTAKELETEVKKLKVGDNAKLTVIRDGDKMEFNVKVGDRNAEQ